MLPVWRWQNQIASFFFFLDSLFEPQFSLLHNGGNNSQFAWLLWGLNEIKAPSQQAAHQFHWPFLSLPYFIPVLQLKICTPEPMTRTILCSPKSSPASIVCFQTFPDAGHWLDLHHLATSNSSLPRNLFCWEDHLMWFVVPLHGQLSACLLEWPLFLTPSSGYILLSPAPMGSSFSLMGQPPNQLPRVKTSSPSLGLMLGKRAVQLQGHNVCQTPGHVQKACDFQVRLGI